MNRPATFPSLDVGEIVDSCTQWRCQITAEDVQHPTPGAVQSILEFWMITVLGLNCEDCRRAASDQLDHMEHSDIYREMMYISMFQKALNQLLQRAAIDDFTTKDLTAPTSIRFRAILSALINFYLFEQEQSAEYLEPMQDEDEALIVEEEELIKVNERMTEEIDAIREERRLNELKSVTERAATELLLVEINELKTPVQALRAKTANRGETLAKVKSELEEVNAQIRLQEVEISRVRGLVLQSPGRAKSTVDDLAIHIAREQESYKMLEQKERGMVTKITILAKYEDDLKKCVKILDDWKIDVDRATDAKGKYQQLHDNYESLRAEMAETQANISLLERRLTNVRDEIQRFVQKTEQKRSKAEDRHARLADQHEQLLEHKTKLDKQAAGKIKEAVAVESEIRAIHTDFQRELERGESSFKKIKDHVGLYSIRMNKALDSINSQNAQPNDFS